VVDSNGSLPRRIRVLVVDDYVGVRHAIATAVATFTDLELAGQASNTEEAIRLCECNRPDVILMDVSLPGIGGAAATSVILERCPASRVIVTCTFQKEALIPEALSAGAVGHLLKNVSANELASTIRAAYDATPST
jgi:NarL family two-component system response regulator LiaR